MTEDTLTRIQELEADCETLKRENTELKEEILMIKQTVQQQKLYLRRAFEPYFTEEVLDEILKNIRDFHIRGERRRMTILFADLRHSTELSEKMDPTDFINMLNHYLGEMIELVNAWHGNILDFLGDAIIAIYGGVRENEESARDAIASSVAMQRRMPVINEWNQKQGYPELAMGIGIHTGDAIIGNIGSSTRTKYDIIGRNVNLASRIQGYAEGGKILITTETLEAAGKMVIINPDGEMKIKPKGIQSEILVHDVIGFGSRLVPGADSTGSA